MLKFCKEIHKSDKLQHMFPKNINSHDMNTRKEDKYDVQFPNTERLQISPIIYMQKLLNMDDLKNQS